MRCVMTRVLPLPAPASSSSGPSTCDDGGLLLRIQALKKIHLAMLRATQCRGETKRF